MITLQNKTGNVDDVEYMTFRWRIKNRFKQASVGPLFTTDVDLWPIYLDSFPQELRQHHNCTTCRRFLQTFGGLATIGERGEVRSALWSTDDADDIHLIPLNRMQSAVRDATVTGVFLTDTIILGQELTKRWAHLSLKIDEYAECYYDCKVVNAHQKMAERVEDHKNIMRALSEFSLESLNQVVELLQSDSLYRSEKVLGPAQFLRDLAAQKGNRSNLVWKAIATAPAGFCHPRSSMVGTLLEDLANGNDFQSAAASFKKKMHPLAYQRPQAAPSVGAIKAAEDLVEKLGIAASLPRRFARLEDLQTLWTPKETPRSDTVFGHLLPSGKKDGLLVAEKTITWMKFERDVLPEAVSMEVLVPERGNFIALVTAQNPDAPPILQWGNPVSWYLYHGGSFADQWNLSSRAHVPVTAITLQPSMWGDREGFEHQGKSAIMILKGATDTRSEGSGGALFPETLRSELHGARSVIEAYSQKATLAGASEATACGIRVGGGGDVMVRVTTRTGSQFLYRIDRWD